jgi:polyvinyl alcohol dehydrogenase (cytochrome)
VDAFNTRFQPNPGLTSADIPKLKLKWAFGVPGATVVRSQPAVASGRVVFGTQEGVVYSLDAATGCSHWATEVSGQVRSGVTVAGDRVFVGDGAGNVHALDFLTGKPLWRKRLDEHPAAIITSTPAYHDGRIYVGVASFEEALAVTRSYACCTFRGSVVALDAATGSLEWKTYTVLESPKPGKATRTGARTIGPSGAGVWSAPTLDLAAGLVYVLTGDNYSDPPTQTSDALVALRMRDGALLWSKQYTAGDAYNSSCPLPDKVNCPDSSGPDHDFGAPPILVHRPRPLLLLAQKSGEVRAVDPARKGEIVWRDRPASGGVLGGIQWGPASDGVSYYVARSDISFTRNRVPGSNDITVTNDPKMGGGLFAYRVQDGERIWMAPPADCSNRPLCSPAQSAPVTVIPGVVFSGAMDGHLRAYDAGNGSIIWDFDTVREFPTINGVKANGGAIDTIGVVAAGGMLFTGSGYAQFGGMAGNVILAFGK